MRRVPATPRSALLSREQSAGSTASRNRSAAFRTSALAPLRNGAPRIAAASSLVRTAACSRSLNSTSASRNSASTRV